MGNVAAGVRGLSHGVVGAAPFYWLKEESLPPTHRRVSALKGPLVKVSVYVPPLSELHTTRTVAGWLLRMDLDVKSKDPLHIPHIEELWLHLVEARLRFSFPAGLRSGVKGEDLLGCVDLYC